MKDLHSLLKKQLKEHLNTDVDDLDGPLLDFVKSVNDTYCHADDERNELTSSLEASSSELLDADNRLTGLLGVLEEKVSERTAELELSQQALEKSEEQLRVIYETAPVGIFQSDPGGRYIYANKRLSHMYGFGSPDELMQSISSIAQQIYVDSGEREWVHAQLREEGRLVGYETRRRRKDGTWFWGSLSVQAQLDGTTGRIDHYDGFVLDITARKEADKKLLQAKEAAEGANRSKSIFLANMSHEIRTPLNGIIGLAEVLLSTSLTNQQERFLKQLKSTSYSLLSVLNDILDFSKIEANKLIIDKSSVYVRELVADCLRLVYIQAQEKGLELLFRIHPSVPDIVEGDADRLRQVILNLVSNAIKFTDFGEVLVEVRFESSVGEYGDLTCLIQDTGPGIPPEKLKSIFNAFEQVDGSLTRSRGGTGLGLSISSQLISLMGGKLQCDSEAGKGSTFYFSLPLKVEQDRSGSAIMIGREELAGMRMLVADQNGTSRVILREMLEGWGGVVDEAESIASALSRVEQAVEEKNPYKIIVSDMDLPSMGRESLASEVADNPLASSALVIMLGGVERQLRPAREDVFANAFLYKPVTPSDLFSAIMRALSADAGLHEASMGRKVNVQVSQFPKRILLVEDTPLNQQVAKYMLEGWGHEVTIAENGQEGLEFFISDDFDMVLMDVQMPLMDGLEATGHIRAYEGNKRLLPTPILAMTAHALKGDADTCLRAGMDGYISKPISWKGLFAKIEQYGSSGSGVNAGRTALSHDALKGSFDKSSAEEDFVPSMDNLVARFNNDREFLFDMIRLLLAEVPGRMEKMSEGIKDMDASKIELDSHALKSMLGNFGKNKAYYLAMKIEKYANENKLEQIEEMFSQLEQYVGILQDQLNKLQS